MTQVSPVSGGVATLAPEVLQALKGRFRGAVCTPGDPGYDEARTVWNAMIDRRPAVVVRAAGAADVIQAVLAAREHGLRLAVRGGGHHIAGSAVCDDGLLLDLSLMKSVRVDPAARTARVEPGVTLGEFDREAQAFGLATPLGINSTTGVAGLTLGGGFGWTSRRLGYTVDNLLSADVVTADGKLVHASATENPELFWALRGGGGNFGVVTSFEYRLHPVGPEVLSGLVVHPFSRAREVIEAYRSLVKDAPDELTCWVVLRKAPPLPFLPADVHGTGILVLAMCYTGDMEEGRKALEPFRRIGEPYADVVSPHPFTGWQTALDPLLTPGARNYWKSHNLPGLTDAFIDVVLDHAGRLPTPECEILIVQLGGAPARVPVEAMAYPHRKDPYLVNVHTRWGDAAQDAEAIAWARAFFDAAAPHASGGVYVNFMPADERERVAQGAYGSNYERLAQLKAKLDPENVFSMNQNITPKA